MAHTASLSGARCFGHFSPKGDPSYPQFKNDQRGTDWKDDHPNDWIRGKGENGKPPNFDRAYRPKNK